VVPSEAPWAEEAWGMKLGHRVSHIRHQEIYVKDHPERRAELDALGFRWGGARKYVYDPIETANVDDDDEM